MLDEAGLTECKIVASNSLDEYVIHDLITQGACIDAFGVGERLITSKSSPVFGGVYKLCAIENEEGVIEPKIKISENQQKITNPHFKKVYRIYDKENGKAMADLMTVYDEQVNEHEPLTIFDPIFTWKTKTFSEYCAKSLLEKIFENGKCVYERPSIEEIREYCKNQLDTLWDEVKRLDNPHAYYVDLSLKLWDIKQSLLRSNSK